MRPTTPPRRDPDAAAAEAAAARARQVQARNDASIAAMSRGYGTLASRIRTLNEFSDEVRSGRLGLVFDGLGVAYKILTGSDRYPPARRLGGLTLATLKNGAIDRCSAVQSALRTTADENRRAFIPPVRTTPQLIQAQLMNAWAASVVGRIVDPPPTIPW